MLAQLERCFTILNVERELHSVKIGACAGVTTQGPVNRPDHPAGEALTDLLRDHLGGTSLPIDARTRPSLLEAGATHPTFIDQLKRTNLWV